MKKIIIGLLILVSVLGGCGPTIPKNFGERTSSELKIDVKLFSTASYIVGFYGYKYFTASSGDTKDHEVIITLGGLACTDDEILFVRHRSGKYDTMVKIQYKDIVDVETPAWGAGRRLVVKCKSNHYTFELVKGAMIDREGTYNFYRFIATKAGLGIKPGFEKKEKVKDKEVSPEKTKSPPEKADIPQQVQPPSPEKNQTPALVTYSPSTHFIVVTGSSANIRAGAGNEFPIVTKVKQGDKLILLGENGEWFNVRLQNNQEGWIGSMFTK